MIPSLPYGFSCSHQNQNIREKKLLSFCTKIMVAIWITRHIEVQTEYRREIVENKKEKEG